jgi:hypothetical protein
LAVATRHHPLSRKITITVIEVDSEVVTDPVYVGGMAIAIAKITATGSTMPLAVPPLGSDARVDRGARPEVDTEGAPVGET